MGRPDRPFALRYGVAALGIVLATGLRLVLNPVLGESFPFATIFLAVLAAAWYGGFRPALAATVLGAVASAAFLLPPAGSFALRGLENQAGLLFYAVIGFGIAALGGAMRAARDRAEADATAAALQREQLRTTLASIGDAVLVTDAAGRVVSLNPVAEALTAWTLDDARGRPLEEVFHIVNEHTRQPVENPAHRVLRDGGVVGLANHTLLVARDGRETPIDDSAAPIRGADGRVAGVVLVFRDVTERKSAERAVRDQAQILTGILAATVDHIYVVDREGRYRHVSAGGARVMGFEPHDLTGKHWRELGLPAAVMERFDAQRDKVLRSGVPATEEAAFRTAQGEERSFEYVLAPIAGADGRAESVVVVSRDVTERRKVESSLRLQARVLESMSEGVSLCDEGGTILYTNPAEDRMFGYGPGELVGRHVTVQNAYPPEENRRIVDEVIGQLKARGVWAGEWSNRRKDDTRFTTLARITALEADGERYFVCVQEDITERKRVEQTLRQTQALFDAIVNHAPACIFAKDREGRYLLANESLARLVGREQSEFRGRTDYDFFPPEVAAQFGRDDAAIMASGRPQTYEESFVQDGVARTYLTVKFPLRDEGGSPYAACAVATEITDLKRAQTELQSTADRLGLALAAARLGDWSWDATTDLVTLSARAAEIFGIPPDPHLTWRAMQDLLHKEDRDRARRQVEEAVAGRTQYEIEYRVNRPDGTQVWVAASGRAQYTPAGDPLGMFGVVQDVTERKTAEVALRESEGRFRGLMEQAPFSVQVFAPDGRTVRANRAWEELWGVTLDQLADYNVLEDAQLESKGVLPLVRRAFAGEPVQIPAIRYDPEETVPGLTRHADPSRWVAAVAYPLRDVEGRVREVVLIHEDMTARMRAEVALRASEATLRAFYDHSPVCLGVTEPTGDGDVLHVYDNPASCRFFGTEPGSTANRRALAELGADPAVVERWLARYRESEATGRPVHFEYAFQTPAGPRWLAATVCAIGPGTAGRTRFCYVAEDVTERRERQEVLRQSEERLRLALEAGRMGVWDWDIRTNEIRWSDNLEPLHGLAPGTFGGTFDDFQRLIHPDDQDAVGRAIARSLEQLTSYDIEFRTIWPDGSVHWISGTGMVFPGDDGRPARMIGVGMDITARKRAEQDTRFLADASATLAGLVDYQSTLQKVARLAVPHFADWAAVDILGEGDTLRRVAVAHIDPSKVELAHEIHRRYPPDPAAPQGVWHVARTGRSELIHEISDGLLESTVKDADLLRILRELGLRSYMGVPLTVRGKVLGVITFIAAESGRRYDAGDLEVAEDLAYRAAVAIENARLYQEVREADRRKDEFLAVLGHELRNPLAPISNALQVLKMPGANGRVAEQARDMMERQVQHMIRLVDDLMDVSRIVRGKVELRREPVELAAVVARAVETAQPLVEAEGHELTVVFPREPLRVSGDPVRLAQVVGNLLNNAARYTDRGGEIRVEGERVGDTAVLRVRDTGIGIAPEVLPRIWDMFVQADRREKAAQGGMGIGLALVKGLVEVHGGTVAARSDGPGRGSEFVVTLPLLPAREPNERPGPGGAPHPRAKSRRVLVVDDNVDAAESLAMLLRLGGHDVRVAYDARTALALAEVEPPELAFFDIGMPGMDGLELAREFREREPLRGVTLVALTGWGQEEDRRRTKDSGFDAHEVKPVSPEVLEKFLGGR